MNRRERLDAAIRGEAVDRIPFGVWWHMSTQLLGAEATADMHLAMLERCDVDFLKLMNDDPYPVPDDFTAVRSEDDWLRLADAARTQPPFRKQLEVIERVRARAGDDVHVVETVFDPFGVARRTGKDRIFDLMRERPDTFTEGLEAITASLEDYLREAVRRGASGVYLAVYGVSPFFSSDGSGYDRLTTDEFRRFVAPYDRRILDVAREAGIVTFVHLHGEELLFDEVLDYPMDVLNWAHLHAQPSLAEARERTPVCLMGGFNESMTNMYHPDDVVRTVKATVEEAGTRKFVFGPGCALPADLPIEYVDLMRASVRALAVA